jgi:hypothetical protein
VFKYESDEPGTFRCSFVPHGDSPDLHPCDQEGFVKKVRVRPRPRKFDVQIQAVDEASNPDPTPATATVKVVKKR